MMEDLGHHFLHHQHVPVIFPSAISHWQASKWTPQNIANIFQQQKLAFRIGKRESKDVQWEAQCEFKDATISEFLEWESGETISSENQLSEFTPDKSWCYCDYKHLPQLFGDREDVMEAVDWGKFGFPGRGGKESTFWLGTAGAHTQCHYDTYGCNLVAQIHGRKRWILFPPSLTNFMYPTRVPYEESSVFSKVNVSCPDLNRHPLFKRTSPMVVTLEPGDVLFVPRHWWHDVESLTTSLSINSWIEMELDNRERVREALTRCIVMAMMDATTDIQELWLNPTEDMTEHEVNVEYLLKSLSNTTEGAYAVNEEKVTLERKTKKAKSGDDTHNYDSCGCDKRFKRPSLDNIQYLKSLSFSDFLQLLEAEKCPGVQDEGGNAAGTRKVGDFEIREPLSCCEASPSTGDASFEERNKQAKEMRHYVEVAQTGVKSQVENTSRDALYRTLVECLTDPSVIDAVYEQLQARLNLPT